MARGEDGRRCEIQRGAPAGAVSEDVLSLPPAMARGASALGSLPGVSGADLRQRKRRPARQGRRVVGLGGFGDLVSEPPLAATLDSRSISPCRIHQAARPSQPHNVLVRSDLLAAPLLVQVWEQPDNLSHVVTDDHLGSEQTYGAPQERYSSSIRSTQTSHCVSTPSTFLNRELTSRMTHFPKPASRSPGTSGSNTAITRAPASPK
jgi:hypothetical protein